MITSFFFLSVNSDTFLELTNRRNLTFCNSANKYDISLLLH